MKKLEEIVKNLHEINFGADGIIRPTNGGADYDYDKWKEKGAHIYDNEQCYCPHCDNISPCIIKDGEGYFFANISHGTHTYDFIMAHNRDEKDREKKFSEVEGWAKKPVLFVMENPGSMSSNSHKPMGSGKKQALESWYWLDSRYSEPDKDYIYPNFFRQREYGKLVYSIINTFKIANGYLTNMVKCGILDGNGEYVTTDNYNGKIVDNCIEMCLKREIAALRGGDDNQKVIIFAFGQNTYGRLIEKFTDLDKYSIYLLPHPVNRLANDYRKYVLYGKIARALYKNDFYNGADVNFISALGNDREGDMPDLRVSVEKAREVIVSNKELFSELGNLEEKNGYSSGKVTFNISFLNEEVVNEIVLRYKFKKGEAEYKVLWAGYNFYEDYVDLWGGKYGDEATEAISESERLKFGLYNCLYNSLAKIVEELKNGKTN